MGVGRGVEDHPVVRGVVAVVVQLGVVGVHHLDGGARAGVQLLQGLPGLLVHSPVVAYIRTDDSGELEVSCVTREGMYAVMTSE